MKGKRIDQFINQDVIPIHEETIKTIVEKMRTDLQDIKDNFKKELTQAIDKVKKLQQDGELETVGYLVITKLRTELAEQHYSYRIKSYNKYFYFDNNQKDIADMDVSWCYSCLDNIREKLYKEARKYFMYVTPNDVDNVMQILGETYHDFVMYVYLKAVEEMDMEELMSEITVEEDFMLLIGEYMAETVTLYEKGIEEELLEEELDVV